MPVLHRLALSAVVLTLFAATTAVAWEEPSHWSDVGAVTGWLSQDAQLYRYSGDLTFLNQSQKNVDQKKAYEESRVYEGQLVTIGLAGFLALPENERADRIKAARKHRQYIERFRMRMASYVQQSKSNLSQGWGTEISDVRTMGECLRNLRTAVGLDPANPYAWHVYSLFSYVVGDLNRAALALTGAEAALAEVPADQLADLRADVALDRAWLSREMGNFARATAAVDAAVAAGAEGFDVTLLRGLIAAQTGDEAEAVRLATELRAVDIRKYPATYASTSFSPEISNMGAWTKKPSGFAQDWIMSLFWLGDGETDMARHAFGDYRVEDAFPQSWRFWQDAGRIYDLTGRPQQAQMAWNGARIWRPYSPYFPVKSYAADLGGLTGRGGGQPVFLAFDSFLVAGNPLALGYMLATEVANHPDDLEAQGAAARALDVLDWCLATGVYPAQAHLLRGAIFNRMGDLQTAVFEVEECLAILEAQGDGPGTRAVLAALGNVRDDHSAAELQKFFSQSGSMQARSTPPTDPAATEQTLREAYAADANDANRQALAYHLIRYGDPAAGREMVVGQAMSNADDLKLALEADRALGQADLALELVAKMDELRSNPAIDAAIWTLAGFVCIDAEHTTEGRQALERALELDPGNHALKIQLQLLPDG